MDDFVDRNNVTIIPVKDIPGTYSSDPRFAVFNDAWKVYDDSPDTDQAV